MGKRSAGNSWWWIQHVHDHWRYASKQVISTRWITKSQTTQQDVGSGEYGIYGYGYQLWTCKSSDIQNPIDYFYANGIYGQYIFVVAVAKSQLQNDNQSLPRLFFEEFLRSLKNEWLSRLRWKILQTALIIL